MTLNGVIALILCFFSPNLIAMLANYVKVVEDSPVMTVKYCLAVPVFHFWHCGIVDFAGCSGALAL